VKNNPVKNAINTKDIFDNTRTNKITQNQIALFNDELLA